MYLLSVPFVADLGSPKGIRFSDVTDTSATVHWVPPKARLDSNRVTYVPAHGGQWALRLNRCSFGTETSRLLTARHSWNERLKPNCKDE